MNFFKKHKKGLIILTVIVLVIGGIVVWFKSAVKKGMDMINAAMANEIVTAEKRDIVSVVSATGKITSIDSRSITSTATGAKVLEVKVLEGDEVKEGDVIAILDSSSYEENLANLEESLNNSKKSNNLSISSAKRQLDETVASTNASNDKYNTQVADLEKKLEDYKNLKEQSLNLYKQAVIDRTAAQTAYEQALRAITSPAAPSTSGNDPSANDPAQSQQLPDVSALLQTYNAAQANEATRLSNYNTILAQYEATETSLNNMKETRDEMKRNSDASVAARQDALSSARIQSNSATTNVESQIDTVKDQIESCTVTAPIDGVITSVSVTEGAQYAGTPIAVIEDTSSYEITAEIDEYDIGAVKKGQKVVIKTNGTGDAELEGVVKSVAPRASMGASGVTYKVVISVLTKNDLLKLDMTAKLSIVLEEAKNTLTVPYDAVETDDDGREYVNVVDGKDENNLPTTHKVYVTTGISSAYYIEILSGDLKEGDEVTVERENTGAFDFNTIFGVNGNETGGM
ncbi:MAG: efflux RND transporter periplasmic adaptor subunit [Lachnospiraceae bacterium]|nr:efflux RND transporter periplasmic adaptor subunit [Lachnospiraceae bacterium]